MGKVWDINWDSWTIIKLRLNKMYEMVLGDLVGILFIIGPQTAHLRFLFVVVRGLSGVRIGL